MKNRDPYCNVGESIAAKIGVNLHRQPNHPLHIIKTKIEGYFDELHQKHGCVRASAIAIAIYFVSMCVSVCPYSVVVLQSPHVRGVR